MIYRRRDTVSHTLEDIEDSDEGNDKRCEMAG